MCNYAILCLYFFFFESWANFAKASYVCVSIYFIACILERLMDFATSQFVGECYEREVVGLELEL